jgi:hypothetical protein
VWPHGGLAVYVFSVAWAARARADNKDLYKFEQMLESGDESPNEVKDQKRST